MPGLLVGGPSSSNLTSDMVVSDGPSDKGYDSLVPPRNALPAYGRADLGAHARKALIPVPHD
ncbi:hypothetical protein GCM10022420_003240 [Streptomyces iranensis]